MDGESPAQLSCICGRIFSQPNALTKHSQSCRSSKKRLANALEQARRVWKGTKRRRLQNDNASETLEKLTEAPGLAPLESLTPISGPNIETLVDNSAQNEIDDSHLTVMERRPWMKRLNRRLPVRFRDPLPQPLPCIPPPSSQSCPFSEKNSSHEPLSQRLRRVFTTPRNIFGLSRRYETTDPPSHDPEDHLDLNAFSDIPHGNTAPESPSTSFYPYPNLSSFRLGHWYWNGGTQKSQSSFRELVKIISDPEFKSADVHDTQWDSINRTLGCDDASEEWTDEDAGWINTPVTINVPYQSKRGIITDHSNGPREYTVPEFYHRNLISIIREHITNPTDHQHYHYEPYELNWQPGANPRLYRTYGELYTSTAFINAHRDLQDSPPEPGCDLPRSIVALMFWSDVTHLTSFGDTKIWPLYLFFGNESKYRRCKPSCNLCHHVAYFQKVRLSSSTHFSLADWFFEVAS